MTDLKGTLDSVGNTWAPSEPSACSLRLRRPYFGWLILLNGNRLIPNAPHLCHIRRCRHRRDVVVNLRHEREIIESPSGSLPTERDSFGKSPGKRANYEVYDIDVYSRTKLSQRGGSFISSVEHAD
jgi:hypothetical protein